MRIQVSGKQIEIGQALRVHVEARINDAMEKYAHRPVEAQITFARDGSGYRCDALAHLSTGLTAQAAATAPEIYQAADQAVERLEKQLRRYKRRLTNHHKRGSAVTMTDVPYFVISPDDDAGDVPTADNPLIIAEMKTPLAELSVSDAVMQMEMRAAPFLVFRNQREKRVNVIYRRQDGNIGWIDPR